MKPSVYIEKTIIGYLTIRPPKEVSVLSKVMETKRWWAQARQRFEVFTSELTVRESSAGDPVAAGERINLLNQLPTLLSKKASVALAEHLLTKGALPAKARADAEHVAIAAVSGMDYLLTWNCRHIANAALRKLIEQVCRDRGFEPPIICTPSQLAWE